MTPQERNEKLKKFYQDPDWVLVEEILLGKIASLESNKTIDPKQSAEVIAAEVRGRQIAAQELESFLVDSKLLRSNDITRTNVSFE